jgi:hypothetical protein
VPCCLVVGKQHFGDCAASIFRVEVRDQGDYSLHFCLPREVLDE